MAEKRSKNQKRSVSREKILNIAEKHFANYGYEGTALRKIASEAKVQLSLISYYFPSKKELYNAVFERHTTVVNEERLEKLSNLESGESTIRALVYDLVKPLISYGSSGTVSTRRYMQLVAQLFNSPEKQSTELIKQHFDPIAEKFIDEFSELFPNLDRRAVTWAYVFTIGCALSALSNPKRVSRLSTEENESPVQEELERILIPFLEGGWDRLSQIDEPEVK